MKIITVLLVEDHSIVRQGLHTILDPDPQFKVVAEAATGSNALQLVEDHEPDVVLLDLKLADMSGVDVCHRILENRPETAILILTAFLDRNLLDACLRAGARGYLLKDAEDLHLRERIIAAVEGHSALAPQAAGILADFLRTHDPEPDILTPREMQVLHLMSRGFTNSEIGEDLFISENTVKGHVKHILAKLNARNRIEAVVTAKDRGLV